MAALLLTLAGLVGALTVLLAVPLNLAFAAEHGAPGEPSVRTVRLRWLFGLVDVALVRPGARGAARRAPDSATKQRRRRPVRRRLRRLIVNPAFWVRLRFLVVRLIHTARWHAFRLHVRFGFDDPAQTGWLWGVVGPLSATLIPARADVVIQPVFEGSMFTLQGAGELRLVPLRVLGVVLAFCLSPATWRVVWPALRSP